MDQVDRIYMSKVISIISDLYNISMVTLYAVTMVMGSNQITTLKSVKGTESMTIFLLFFYLSMVVLITV